jgi:nitrogen-specific signal transduction histidine kinase/CheY-like chemotaxis protein
MDHRPNPLDVLLKAVEAGDLKGARAAAEVLSHGPGHNPMQLASEVLHELKQPLLGIKGYIQMLGEDPGPHRPMVPLVLAQVERIEHIVSDFVRLATNRPAPKERLAVATHVREAVAQFQRNPDSARTQVDVDLAPGLEMVGSGRLVEQLLVNLLNNARDAMSGRGRIKVLGGREAGAIALYVADWGPGIAPEVRERLFEPYVTSRPRGSGLGLAVCRRIADEHHATIELVHGAVIAETPPPATVFRVRFPSEIQSLATQRRRLLVVDDEPMILRIFRDLMGKECDVVEAETAEIGLGHLRAGAKFDLIITDKNLPGVSGLELAQEARRLDPSSRVMVMTGYPSLVTAQQALQLGVVEYLLKPFDDIREVREKIRGILATERTPASRPAPANRRVDVYEDNELSAKAISEALVHLGLEPHVMTEAVPGGQVPPFGVVVSWDFGPARGKAAVELGKSMSHGGPFIVLVEHLSMETTLEALRAGSAACLPKLLSDSRALSRELSRALKTTAAV